MSGTTTLTAIGTETISTSSPDIEAIFQTAAAAIATISASDKFTYNGNTPPQGDGKSVLFVPASVIGNVTIPAGYAYVVVEQGSKANLFNPSSNYTTPVIVGDGFNFSGIASVVANGGGPSNIQDTSYNPYGPGGGDVIHTAGTGTVSAGTLSSIIVDAGANVTVDALYHSYPGNKVTVSSGATATVADEFGTLNILTGAKTTVSLRELGSTNIYIGVNPGATPTVPPTPPTPPTTGSNATPQTTPVFTNQIVVAGNPDTAYVSHQRVPPVANNFVINDANSVNLIALGVTDTVTLSVGASTIFGQADNLINAAGNTGVFFVGGADTLSAHSIDPSKAVAASNASTIIGGGGNSTVFATAGDVFNLGTGQANIFVGGNAASTINANADGGGGDFFGGSHGDLYNAGNGYSQIFVGDGGADTISVGAGRVAPLVYAEGAERLLLVSSAASTLVGFTHGGVINAANTTGNNALFAGYGVGGNQTLIGSTSSFDALGNALHDTFVVGANPAGTATSLVIDNWHSGDVFYLSGFNAYDTTTMDNAIANSLARGAAGDLTFTLSDQSTITFVGGHPTNYSGNAAF